VRVRTGLYAIADRWPDWPADRHLLTALGVVRQHQGRIALSHHTAAVAHGLPTWGVPHARPRFVRFNGLHTRTGSLVVGRRWPDDAYRVCHAAVVVNPAVAALQIAMTFGVEQGLVTLDAALHHELTTATEVALWLSRVAGHRHCVRARQMVAASDGFSESPGETRLRYRLAGLGYDLQSQVRVSHGGRFLARVDLFDPARQVVIEFDGRVKYQTVQPGEALMAEKRREDELRAAGFGVARFTWDDLDDLALLRSRMERAASLAAPNAELRDRQRDTRSTA
jgi:very-short-patch-repair endonuclease